MKPQTYQQDKYRAVPVDETVDIVAVPVDETVDVVAVPVDETVDVVAAVGGWGGYFLSLPKLFLILLL